MSSYAQKVYNGLARLGPDPNPRRTRLYSDAYQRWLGITMATISQERPLYKLVTDLLRRTDEVSEDEERQIRADYGLEVRQ